MRPSASSWGGRIQVPRPGDGDISECRRTLEDWRESAHLSRRANQPAENGVCRLAGCWRRLRWRDRWGNGPVAINKSANIALPYRRKEKTYRLPHLLHQPPNNTITKTPIPHPQSQKIRKRQPHPFAVLVRFVHPIIGVVLIAVRVVREEFAGVEIVAVDFEGFMRGGVQEVEINRQARVGLRFGSGEDSEGFGREEGGVDG